MPTLQDSVRRAMRIAPSKVRAQDFRDPHETVYLFVHRKECSRCQQYKQSPRKKKYESGKKVIDWELVTKVDENMPRHARVDALPSYIIVPPTGMITRYEP